MPKKEQNLETAAQEKPVDFEFKDLKSLEEYLEWKQNVPVEFRQIIEARMKRAALAEGPISELPLTNEFLKTFERIIRDNKIDLEQIDERTANILKPLAKIGTQEGFINAFEVMADKNLSWAFKRALYDLQIKPGLEWLINQDLEEMAKKISEQISDGKKDETLEKQKELKEPTEEQLPPDSEEAISSMEADMEKREGEPSPHFSVKSFWGGYYKRLIFNKFNPASLKWEKPTNKFREPSLEQIDSVSKRILFGAVRGNKPMALPLPDNWSFDPSNFSIDTAEEKTEIFQNQDGIWYLKVNQAGPPTGEAGVFRYQIGLARKARLEETKSSPEKTEIKAKLPDEIISKISELRNNNLQPMALARAIVRIIRNHLEYSNDSAAYQSYKSKPADFFKKIWEIKKADCHVANTLAIAALSQASINPRFIAGYFVKDKNERGDAVMHSGNGHAWLEVWDNIGRKWLRLDATPKGDPIMDEEVQEQDLKDEPGEGDFGESEQEIMSEEKIKEKIQEMKKQQGNGAGQKEKSRFDMIEERFAELAECSTEQAKEFLNALERVRQIKDEKGILIVDLLKNQWRKIVSEYKVLVSDYKGPVRMDEGDRLEDPVSARIDIKTSEYNPLGFEKEIKKEKIQSDFGGINLYFSFDLSGSMSEADPASGRPKADVQRDAALLFIDALTQCAFISRQEKTSEHSLPIKIMATLASSHGQRKLALTDKWTEKEQWAFYSALTKLASGGTPTHETLELIEEDYDKELADLKKKNIPQEKQPIHYAMVITDGAPDDSEATEAMEQKLTNKGMVVRPYLIGVSGGVESFSRLPQILSDDIIKVFQKLKPRRIT